MKRLLSLALATALAGVASNANATAAALFPAGGDARVAGHNVVVSFNGTSTVTWDSLTFAGSINEVGIVVAVKAGGTIEITEPAWTEAAEQATRVVVRAVPDGVTCKSVVVNVPGNVDFDASITIPPVRVKGSGSGGCSGESTTDSPEATGGCLGSSQGGCGSCDGNGGGCEPSDHGHPGCSAIHGCAPASEDFPFGRNNNRTDSGSTPRVGPYESTRLRAADGTASSWLTIHGYAAPAGFLDGVIALEASGYEVYGYRAISPAPASLVQSLRIVTSSPDERVPLRLVRMSTRADEVATPVTLITFANGARDLAGKSLVTIDENRLARIGDSSNYEDLVTAALTPSNEDSGAKDAGASADRRWLLESSRVLSPSESDAGADGGTTLGDLFADTCGPQTSELHTVCGTDAGNDDDAGEAGVEDAGDGGDAGDAGAPDLDGGTCTDVSRQRCDDLTLALRGQNSTATRFRGLIGGAAVDVDDLTFTASTAPLREARFTVRATGEAGLCEPVEVEGQVSGSFNTDSPSCRSTRSRYRVDLGPLVLVLVVVRSVSFILRRRRR